MSSSRDKLDLKSCRERLKDLETVREEILKIAREVRINATKAIASIHAQKSPENFIDAAVECFKKLKSYEPRFPELYHPLAHDAEQELVEAMVLRDIIEKRFDFSITLNVKPSAFVTGLADVIGELRRYVLTCLIGGKFEESRNFIELMEEIYANLLQFVELPDKLVPGLRRKLDVARSAIERTKSDYIAAKVARFHESLGRNR